jgi:hypothetical protein
MTESQTHGGTGPDLDARPGGAPPPSRSSGAPIGRGEPGGDADLTGQRTWRQVLGSWRAIVFAPIGDGQTRRRGSDAFRLGTAVLGVFLWLATMANSHAEHTIATMPGLSSPTGSDGWSPPSGG